MEAVKLNGAKTDFELMERIGKRDMTAFNTLFTRYHSKVYGGALRILMNELDAEEVANDVFTAVWRKASSFRFQSQVNSWLFRITANCAFMLLRSRKKHSNIFVPKADIWRALVESWDSGERIDMRAHCGAELSEIEAQIRKHKYGDILMYRLVDNLSNNEVSKIKKLSVPAVKSRYHRVKAEIRSRNVLRRIK